MSLQQVRLTWPEVATAAYIGICRHIKAKRTQHRDRFDAADQWAPDIEGACGEMALAKALGVYWLPKIHRSTGDVGAWEVRTARGQLVVRPGDADDAIFIFVRGRAPLFDIVGWIRGGDAKRSDWFEPRNGNPPAWFVPDAALRPMDDSAMYDAAPVAAGSRR